MSIFVKLSRYLSHLPYTQTVSERRVLVRLAGVDHLQNRIHWEGTALVFCDRLLDLLHQEGQDVLLRFLQELSTSGLFGVEHQADVQNFHSRIANIPYGHWRHIREHHPRIFVSYHAKDAQSKQFFNLICTELEVAGYEVLADRDGSTLNDPWRIKLLRDVGGCDAGLILLTEQAFAEESVYTDSALMRWRQWSETNFKLIPVCVDGSSIQHLQKGFWPQLEFYDKEIVEHVKANVLEIIKQRLSPLKKNPWQQSIVERREYELAKCFDLVDEQYLCNALAAIGEHCGQHMAQFQTSQRLAREVFRSGPDVFPKIVTNLGKDMESKSLKFICELIAPSWVDLRAAGIISKAKSKRREGRLFYLNARHLNTGKMYIRQACHTDDLNLQWTILEVTGKGGDDILQQTVQEIQGQLAAEFFLDSWATPSEINEILEDDEEMGPIFVLFPPELADDRELIEYVQQTYPMLVLFVLIGDADIEMIETTTTIEDACLLKPMLEPGVEQKASRRYQKNRMMLKRYLKGA